MLACDEDVSTRDLVSMLNVPLEAIPAVVQETGRLLASRLPVRTAEDAVPPFPCGPRRHQGPRGRPSVTVDPET